LAALGARDRGVVVSGRLYGVGGFSVGPALLGVLGGLAMGAWAGLCSWAAVATDCRALMLGAGVEPCDEW